MGSWNHHLFRLPDETRDRYAQGTTTCSWPRCRTSPTHEGFFDSVTGSKGRVNSRRKLLCDTHAVAFALTHNLTVEQHPHPEQAVS